MLWYFSFQKRQRGLAAIDAETAAGFVHVFFYGGFRKAQPDGDFLVRQEGREPQAFFLSCAEALRHVTLRTSRIARAWDNPRPVPAFAEGV